jgi:murein DD-endopeptidase MepM/ murein hydrolase activator NlpD
MGRGRAYLSIVVMAIAASAAATPPALTVTTRARAVQPGELVLFTILAAQPVSQVTVRAFGRDWPAYEDGSARRWRAPVGIDLDTRPATYHAEIAAGEDRTSYPLVVRARAFRTRHLTVNPDLVNPPPDALERIDAEARELSDLWAHGEPQRLWSGPFVRPVPDEANSAFGTRSVYNGEARSPHSGADFLSPEGRPVKAPNAGRIVLAGARYFTGNTVIVDHGLGMFSLFAHFSRIDVQTGERVERGQVLGESGATGRVTGPHLHWALRLGDASVDPLAVISAVASLGE